MPSLSANPMTPAVQTQYQRLLEQLGDIQVQEENALSRAKASMLAVQTAIRELRMHILENNFTDADEEIRFFKQVKPQFFALLIYQQALYHFELGKPTGPVAEQKAYVLKTLAQYRQFFEENKPFYQYYRSGCTLLDHIYFLRDAVDPAILPRNFCLNTDQAFSTSHDGMASILLAHDQLCDYFNRMLVDRFGSTEAGNSSGRYNPPFSWTASKASLIELIYALHADGSLNHGHAELKEIASYLQHMFNVEIGNFYRTFQEIRIRKKCRTQFLDQLREKLLLRMDETDENPR